MFKLYSEISSLSRFSNGFCTEYIDFVDSMNWFEIDVGLAYICPEKPDYYFGHCVNLFKSPATDIDAEYFIQLWDEHLAQKAPKALKRVVCWEDKKFINYPDFDSKFDFECNVQLKFSPQKVQVSRPEYNIKIIKPADLPQMVEIYVADAGEKQREHTEWMVGNRMDAIAAGHANFFAIWNVDRGEIAAIAGLYWKDGIYRYASVATRKAYRGRGYASAIIAYIRDYALQRGAQEIYIMAENGSQAAGIYINAGFEVDGYIYSIMSDR